MAIVLLDGLSSDAAVDTRVSGQIRALIQATLDAGLKPGATADQRAQAEAILLYGDRPTGEASTGTSATAGDSPGSSSAVVAAIDRVSLPTRMYMHVGDQVDRGLAERAGETLRDAGLIVPGIEVVGAARSPQGDSVRYCADKVTDDALDLVTIAMNRLPIKPSLVVLDPKLCRRVRLNHFELWLARR